uniref:Uncharacterized protein n=1 Tax=Kwoniella dejecticola CBS 10117 TaxID=1296121 RepID=A0A1A5ZZF1_9TREE|nr:uncharacterized protein I303_06742 [Kwoniella dejecticola CBS 10117]OBR83183.1 hypothetical protein I303_06742 [Kwoniella dejecticola CBS 10117]
MQLAGRLYPAWSLMRERLRHRNLLIFLLLHVTTSAALFILSILSVETNAEASHFLRHIIQTANLSSVVFYNPDSGRSGDWRNAPALIVDSDDVISRAKDDGIICNDDGKKCRGVGEARHTHEKQSQIENSNNSTTSVSTGPSTSTMTITMTTQGNTIITRVLIVPTLTVMQGEAITTQVMLNEQGNLMTTETSPTIVPSTFLSSTKSAITTVMAPSVAAPTSTATATVAAKEEKPEKEDGDEEEEEEDEDDDESVDSSDDSDDSSDSDDDEVEDQAKPKTLKMAKEDFVRNWRRDVILSGHERGGKVVGVNIAQLPGSSGIETVSQQCAIHYGWAINSLDNLVREETVLATFFMWIMGLAIVGLLNESMPHLLALLVSLLISSIWTANGLRLSFKFLGNFQSTANTYCEGINVLPMYLDKRIGFQSTVLGLSLLTMIASAWLCWKIRDHFGWQPGKTFQRIGASTKINRIYKLVLALSILLQVDAFVLVTFFALFLDQISNGPASYFMHNCKAFKAIYSLLIIALFPWLYLGWTSIRKEQRKRFNVFIGLSACIVGGWALSFANKVFRIVFTTWAFFTAMGSLAAGLTIITVILALIRRWTFGKGLADFLYLEEIHERPTEGFDEKASLPVPMPQNHLPTFSTAFGPGPAPPPRQMFPAMPVYLTATRVSNTPSWTAGDDARRL